jgi:hypothetical protein
LLLHEVAGNALVMSRLPVTRLQTYSHDMQ